MPRTITVKGTGRVTARPDYVVLTMKLETKNKEYDSAMDAAAKQLAQLNDSLVSIGFEKEEVKTRDFKVHTDYDSCKDKKGNYQRIFSGFVCRHQLKLSFDFDMTKLSQTLSVVANCLAHPELSIAFTVKDPAAVNDALLREVAINAKKKAEVLCEASGVELGRLLTIDYNWERLNIFSKTRHEIEKESLTRTPTFLKPVIMEPEGIDVSESAVFVWEIV